MASESALHLTEIILDTLQSAFWPLVLLVLLLYFGPTLKAFLKNTSELNLSAGGVELAVKRKMEVVAALAAAQATRAAPGGPGVAEASATEIVHTVDKVIEPFTLRQFAGARVLWVDDRPENNVYERRMLEALGIRFTIATSTNEALDELSGNGINVVISDMGRPPDNRAGYTLLSQMREQGYGQPFVIYASSNRPEDRAEARQRGAIGSTNSPSKLFQWVTSAILDGG